jgi:Uma2 family endonuclease
LEARPSTAGEVRSKAQLYARYTVPFYWIVDPTGHTIDAFTLVEGAYRLAARPPFLDLTLDSALIWV